MSPAVAGGVLPARGANPADVEFSMNDPKADSERLARCSPGAKPRGFTLIELMITMVIVAILAAVAYPSYIRSVRKGNRTDAHSALMRVAGNLERFFATNGTYTIDKTQWGLQVTGGNAVTDDGHYVVTVLAGPTGIGTSYVITATAAAGDSQVNDEGCTVLSLSSLGVRLPDPAASRCW
jgi:type IV pilus assembly protein PilE